MEQTPIETVPTPEVFAETQVFFKNNPALPFFSQANDDNRILNDEYRRAEEAAPGYMHRVEEVLLGGRKIVLTTLWASKYYRDLFAQVNEQLVDNFVTARQQFYDVNGIEWKTDYVRETPDPQGP